MNANITTGSLNRTCCLTWCIIFMATRMGSVAAESVRPLTAAAIGPCHSPSHSTTCLQPPFTGINLRTHTGMTSSCDKRPSTQ